jgi:histidinol-phosphate aminotransferase
MVKPRAALDGIEPCEHGGVREGAAEKGVIDFSVSLNPYGPPNFVSEVIREAIQEIDVYPDTDCIDLKTKLAEKFGCEQNEVVVGAGVSELVQLVTLSFVKERVVIPRHTYGEYEPAARLMGAHITRVEMPDLRIDPDMIAEAMQPDDVVFLCNPNNPTGRYLQGDAITRIVEVAERVDALVVLDEAYVDFVTGAFPAHAFPKNNLIILRSLTKSFAIPGIRIGYALSSEAIINELEKVKVPWSVSACAQKVGAAVIGPEGDAFLAASRERIEQSKGKIEKVMDVHTDANFYILKVGTTAREVKKELLEHGILVRDCTSFGLPAHIRFSVRTDEENERLVRFLSITK